MKKQVLILVTLLLPLVASAYDLADDKGLFYNLKGDGTLEVVGLDAETTEADILSDVTIGGMEYRVTSIGERAFEGRSELTYLSIPWSVTSIGEYAFIDCGSNITVNIADPESWCEMELGNEHSSPLSSAGKVLVHDIETNSITIPEGVTSIGNFTFYQCRCITSLTIPASVKSIGSSAFEDCSDLVSLNLSDGLESIGGSAFEGCAGLKILRIPSTVNTISINAFANCTGIMDVYCYAENVPMTDENAFDGTPTENSILHVPSNALEAYKSSWPWSDFKQFIALNDETPSVKRTIHVATAGTLKDFISNEDKYQIEELTLTGELNGTDFRLIRDMAGISYKYNGRSGRECYEFISTNGKLKSLDLTNATIVEGGNPYIETTDFTFTRSLTRTGRDYAYYTKDNCISSGLFYRTNLESIQIPNSVTSIESSAFSGCSSLTSITIPTSVTRIKEFAFSGCSGLTSVYISDLEAWCHIYFESEGPSDTYSSNPLHYAHHLFINGEEIKDLVIPNTIIGIGQGAFDGASNLNSVTIHNRVTRIGNSAFYGCSGLTSVTIPESVTTIGYAAFFGCKGLTSVSIPNSVTSIGNYAFGSCSGLTTIASEIIDPFEINDNVFDIYAKATLIVPSGKKSAYQSTDGWKNFANIVEAGEGGIIGQIIKVDNVNYKIGKNNTMYVTRSVAGLSAHVDNYLGDIVIHDQITYNGFNYIVNYIEGEAFGLNYGPIVSLTSITIPNTIAFIGSDAFLDQGGIEAVYITDLEAWCNIIFEGNPRWSNPLSRAGHLYLNGEEITEMVIPAGVTTINNGAFNCCKGLTSVSIHNGVSSIGSKAFEGCTGLGIIHLGNGVKEIGEKAFANINENNTGTRAGEEGIEVYCYAEEVPNTSEDAFDGTPTEKSTLYVPASALDAYKASWPWNDFKEIVPLSNEPLADKGIIYTVKVDGTLEVTGLEDGITTVDILSTVTIDGKEYQVTSIGKRAFEGRDNIEYLSIPWSVTSIGEFAFIDCGNNMTVNIADPEAWCKMEIGNEHSSPLSHAKKVLVYDIETDQIDIPEGVTSIGKYTFYQCQCIKSLTIPATVTSIGSSAFEGCTELTNVSLSEGLTYIGGSAFESCTGISSITIPSTVTSIAINAFRGCNNLNDITSKIETPFAIDDSVFSTYSTATLTVPEGTTAAYQSAEGWKNFNNITDDSQTAINSTVIGKQNAIETIYSINGEKQVRLSKGINIVRMKDGTIKKVMVN